MKFTGTKENVSRGINIAGYLATRAINLPILSSVLIETNDGGLEISSTNLEIGIKTRVRGKIDKEGRFTVKAKTLLDYVNLLPLENIDLETGKDQLNILCGNFHTKLKGQQSDDFPIIPVIKNGSIVNIGAGDLKQALEGVLFAASIDETRPEIGGILVWFKNDRVNFVATDSYRLAEKYVKISGSNQERKVIVPLKTLQEVSRIVALSENIEDICGNVIDNFFRKISIFFANLSL